MLALLCPRLKAIVQSPHYVLMLAMVLLTAASVSSSLLAQTNRPSIRSQSTAVIIPTLVKTKAGEIVFGLSANDFIVEDQGVEQSVQLDESPTAQPVSAVVAVQIGRSATLQFEKAPTEALKVRNTSDPRAGSAPLSGLGTMIESYVGDGTAAVAAVTFDSHVHVLQDFTKDIPAVAGKLTSLPPGDTGAAILDAVLYSNALLSHRPPGDRRVIILISESRDHGSHIAKLETVVRQLSASNTVVYSPSFTPARAEFMRDAKGENPSTAQMDLMKPLVMVVNGLRKNAAAAIAELTGGDYETFGNKRDFDAEMDMLSADDHNRYFLSFQPTDPIPGPHAIRVRLRDPNCACIVTSRNMYWAIAK